MIPNPLKEFLRTKVTLTAIVSKIEYKNKVPSKLLLRKIRKDGFMVIQYLDIKYPSKLETKIRKNQKIEFNGYLIPSIMKDEYKKEFVGIKIKNVSGVKLL